MFFEEKIKIHCKYTASEIFFFLQIIHTCIYYKYIVFNFDIQSSMGWSCIQKGATQTILEFVLPE